MAEMKVAVYGDAAFKERWWLFAALDKAKAEEVMWYRDGGLLLNGFVREWCKTRGKKYSQDKAGEQTLPDVDLVIACFAEVENPVVLTLAEKAKIPVRRFGE